MKVASRKSKVKSQESSGVRLPISPAPPLPRPSAPLLTRRAGKMHGILMHAAREGEMAALWGRHQLQRCRLFISRSVRGYFARQNGHHIIKAGFTGSYPYRLLPNVLMVRVICQVAMMWRIVPTDFELILGIQPVETVAH